MNQTAEQPLTTRERWLEEKKKINSANAKANSEETDVDDDKILARAEQLEKKPLDKNMGTIKIPSQKVEMTKADYLKHKTKEEAKKVIVALQRQQIKHLSEDEQKIMIGMLNDYQNGIIEDPVLIHLIKEKLLTATTFMKNQVEIKEQQQRMMKEVQDTSNKTLKIRGAMESVDRQILKLINNETAEPAAEGSEG